MPQNRHNLKIELVHQLAVINYEVPERIDGVGSIGCGARGAWVPRREHLKSRRKPRDERQIAFQPPGSMQIEQWWTVATHFNLRFDLPLPEGETFLLVSHRT